MNERIENLMYQAGLTAQGCWDQLDSYDRSAIEKFAELIVKECMSIVEGSPWNLPRGYKAVDQAELIKEHFGVEE
jgi:hypothetical protein